MGKGGEGLFKGNPLAGGKQLLSSDIGLAPSLPTLPRFYSFIHF